MSSKARQHLKPSHLPLATLSRRPSHPPPVSQHQDPIAIETSSATSPSASPHCLLYPHTADTAGRRSPCYFQQVEFADGTKTDSVTVEYPLGHRRRRAEAIPVLEKKFQGGLAKRFGRKQLAEICRVALNHEAFLNTAVTDFVELFALFPGQIPSLTNDSLAHRLSIYSMMKPKI